VNEKFRPSVEPWHSVCALEASVTIAVTAVDSAACRASGRVSALQHKGGFPVPSGAGASWAGLDADVQRIVTETAQEMQEVALELGARLDGELLAKLQAAGMQVNEVDKDAFIAASDLIYREFAAQVPGGGPLIEKALALGKGV
jgi:hypothetical protein